MSLSLRALPESASENLLTPHEVARYLSVSAAWVRDHSARKRPVLPAIRVGRFLRYRQSDLDKWIAEQMRELSRRGGDLS